MILLRPVGLDELRRIAASGFSVFPAGEPVFYPARCREHASRLAEEHARRAASGFAGFLLGFELRDDYLASHRFRVVRACRHTELWIDPDRMDGFNAAIDGRIEVEASWYGDGFDGPTDAATGLPVPERAAHPTPV